MAPHCWAWKAQPSRIRCRNTGRDTSRPCFTYPGRTSGNQRWMQTCSGIWFGEGLPRTLPPDPQPSRKLQQFQMPRGSGEKRDGSMRNTCLLNPKPTCGEREKRRGEWPQCLAVNDCPCSLIYSSYRPGWDWGKRLFTAITPSPDIQRKKGWLGKNNSSRVGKSSSRRSSQTTNRNRTRRSNSS